MGLLRWVLGLPSKGGWDDSLNEPDYPTERINPPRKRGKTQAQYEKEYQDYIAARLIQNKKMFSFDARRAKAMGVTHFIWDAVEDYDTCPTCRKLNGKKFRYSNPPGLGPPGTFICDHGEVCRCSARAIIKK